MASAERTSPSQLAGTAGLLGVLALIAERPSYGYEIAARAVRLGIASRSYVYVAIRRLQDQGLIELSGVSGSERQPKVHYQATEAGMRLHREAVARQLLADVDRSGLKNRLLSADGTSEGLLAMLDLYEQLVLEALAQLRPAGSEACLSDRLAVLHDQMALDRELDFIKHARVEIEAAA